MRKRPVTEAELEEICATLGDVPGVTRVEATPAVMVRVCTAPGVDRDPILDAAVRMKVQKRHLVIDFRIWKTHYEPTEEEAS